MNPWWNPMFGAGLSVPVCAIVGFVLFQLPGAVVGAAVGVIIDLIVLRYRRRYGGKEFQAQDSAFREQQKAAPLSRWFYGCTIALFVFEMGYVGFAHAIFHIAPGAAIAWFGITDSIYAALADIFWGYDKFAVDLSKYGYANLVPLFQHTFAVAWSVGLLYFVAMLLRSPALVARAARLKYDPESHQFGILKRIKYLCMIIVLIITLIPLSMFPLVIISIEKFAEKDHIITLLYFVPAILSLIFPVLFMVLMLIGALLVPKSLALRSVRKSAP